MSPAQRTTSTAPAGEVTAERSDPPRRTRLATLPMALALLAIASVWIAGCFWSFREQTAFAAHKGFTEPRLLPLILDGLAIAMAGVAYAASLDGRAAVLPRLGTALAVAASAASNGTWAWQRSDGDVATIALGAGVPIVANIAFEVLLSEVRRQVMRRRGLPAPIPIPTPRLLRLVMAPVMTLREWRQLILELTALTPQARPGAAVAPDAALTLDATAATSVAATVWHERESPDAHEVVQDIEGDSSWTVPAPVTGAGSSPLGVPAEQELRTVEEPAASASTAAALVVRPQVHMPIESPAAAPTKESIARAYYLEERSAGREPTNRSIAEAAAVSEGRVRAWKPGWRQMEQPAVG